MTLTPPLHTPPGMEQAQYALDLLRASNLKTYGNLNLDTAEELWATQLKDFPMEVIERAVIEWSKEPDGEFPSMGEFVTVCQMAQRHIRREAATQRGLEHPLPGQRCPECAEPDLAVEADREHDRTHGSDTATPTPGESRPGWVVVDDGDGFGIRTVRPCATCAAAFASSHGVSGPDQHALWANGCYNFKHRPCQLCRNTNLWPAHMRKGR